ncbi:phage tail tape measure protein [Eggerthella timonensis]|uniref:phage tail tape measure protein n=1 Tax=Eggerthella timonensis TaxID=1871008 RepID=UPI000C770477|nr:phage tail tape measure protein [Eggerthella timonensis]
MADVYKGLTVKLGVDISSLSSALRKARSEVSGVATDLRKVERALKLDPGNVKLLAQQQRDYQRQIESTKKQLDLLKQAEKQMEEMDAFTPEQEAQWTKLQSDIVLTEQKLKGYQQALTDSIVKQGAATSLLGKLGSSVEKFGSHVQGFGRGMETVGNGLTRTLTPAVIGVGAASVAAAVQIDTSLTNVKKTVDGTDEQYQKLKQSAIEFSKTNAVDASQILDIQALGAQLGFAIDELDEFGQVVSGLDIATNMDAETAATEMAQFANITKMSHEEIRNYGSAIVGLGNSYATTESDISALAMRVAAAGTQVHMSQADILGLSTALASMGVEAEAGGTAISTLMAQIDKDIALAGAAMAGTSDMTQKEIDKVNAALGTWASTAGMSATEFAEAWKNDPVQALAALLSNMEAATAEGGNMSVMLQELGIDSIRQTDVMKRLAGNSQFVADAVATANDEWSANTALQKEVDNRNQSLAAQFEMLKNRVIAVANDVGGPLASALLDIVDQAEPLIKMIGEGAKQFSEMSKSEQQAVLKAVALSAAIGPLLTVVGKGTQKIEAFGKGIQKVAEFFARMDVKVSSTADTLGDLESSTKKSESATKKNTETVKKSSVAIGAAKTAMVGLIAVVAGFVLKQIIDEVIAYNNALKTAEGATDGLRDAVSTSKKDFSDAVPSIVIASGAIDGYSESARDAMQSQADLAQEIKEAWTDIGTNRAIIDECTATIERLTSKYDENGSKAQLTATEQSELQTAVSMVNDVCGTSYSVIDAQNGILSESVDKIKATTDAWIANAEAQAAQEQMVELKKREYELNGWLAKSTDELREKGDRLAELQTHRTDLTIEERQEQQRLSKELDEAHNNYDWLTDAIEENKGAQESLSNTYSDAQQKLQGTSAAITDAISAHEGWGDNLAEAGVDVDSFAQKLSELGFTSSEVYALSDENMMLLAQSYNLSIDEIIAACDEAGIAVPEKMRQAATGATAAIQTEAPNAAAAMYIMKDGILQAYDPITGELSAATVDATDKIVSSIVSGTPGAVGSMTAMKDGVVYAYDPVTGQLSQLTVEAMAGVAKGVKDGKPNVVNETAALEIAAVGAVDPIKADLPNAASEGSQGFGDSLADGQSTATKNAGSMAAAAMIMNMYSAMFRSWGSHASHNFAAGIMSGYGAAVNAATTIANAVKNILGHSVPKSGPLRNNGKGEKEWGAHAAQNWIGGFRSEIPNLQSTMDEMADVVSGVMGVGARSRSSINVSAAATRAASAPQMSVSVDASGGLTKVDVYEAVGAAMADALSHQPDVVLKISDRELARANRRAGR